MTLANTLRSKIQIQEKVITQGALGETVVWKPVQTIYGRRVPLSLNTVAQYQQLDTVVTDKFIFRGSVAIDLGKHRLLHGSKTYEPQSTSQELDGYTVIIVRKV